MSERRARMRRDGTYLGVAYRAGELAPRDAVRAVELLDSIFDVAPSVTLDTTNPTQGEK